MKFRSKLEERIADLLKELGVSYEYETHKISYEILHIYTPDFILPNGIILEAKGYWDAADRRKLKPKMTAKPTKEIIIAQSP